MEKKIGFIGLGQMGKWMAVNIVKAGFDLTIFDLDPVPVKEVKGYGAKVAGSAKELAGETDWVILSLPNAAIVERVIFGENGLIQGAESGSVIIDCGTTSYLPTLDFGGRLREKNIIFLDAPVSGMEARAREGALTIMCGGDEKIFNMILPVFDSFGNKVLYMGVLGSGQLTKLVNQLLFNISAAAIAEILPMAAKLGLDPEKVTQVVTTGTGRSFAAEFFAPLALENDFSKGYPLKDAYKDMISAAEICAYEKIPLPMVHAATTTYQMALADGYENLGKGAMIKVFERILDVEFRKRAKS